MAIPMSKRRSKFPRKEETKQCCFCYSFLCRILYRVPLVIFLLILVFLWSSSATIISGHVVRVCVSSRKLNNLYCLSAGTEGNIEIPVPRNVFTNASNNSNVKDFVAVFDDQTGPVVRAHFDNRGKGGAERDKKDTSNNDSSVKDSVNVFEANKDPVFRTNVGNDEEEEAEKAKKDNSRIDSNAKGIVNVVRANKDPDIRTNFYDDAENEVKLAKKVVEDLLHEQRSWRAEEKAATCERRGIFVYDLPTKFNKDLVGQCDDMMPWSNICKFFNNDAFGEAIPELGQGWFNTHQYALELIFHKKLLKHPCRVYDEREAKLFYVPYYGGLDILRWHFRNVSHDVKDSLSLELVKWLESKDSWTQHSGKDHVFVLGKISWDFRRCDGSWGTRFLELDQMQNPIKLLIERQPWHVNDIGIPHPTYFHPHSDEDIINWQLKVIRSQRKSLVSFAGGARPGQTENIRSILIDQCTSSHMETCKFLNCSSGACVKPKPVIDLFMESEFCLQPPGDSPTRKSVFDSLISGCIPVLFDPFTAYYQYPWHLPEDHSKYSVFIDQEEVRNMKVNMVERLMKVSEKEKENMRRYIVYELLPGLVYGDLDSKLEKFQDAFSITINNLLERVNRLI
ncbi:xyloglucan-specific galacturonosyltransferase 1 [Mangifera indica]|uniref:xyloglucan-specific galacturonosyltransferase 1 n=1 Tax=Mangifera indica TaxID=29780 RepID=UPI001CF97D48|nr:xyloglucan-specific galacturonosyltransferase 1 [Mangifera indica]